MAPVSLWKRLSQKLVFWVLIDALVFLAFLIVAFLYYPAPGKIEHQIALRILDGQIPYVDFYSEYPPIALLSYLLPGLLFRSPVSYYAAFTVEMLLFDLLAIVLISRTSSKLEIPVSRPLLVHALLILAIGPIVTVRYDIIPAVLVLASLSFFISGKRNTSWAFIGLGVMAKLYPLIIAPFYILYHLRQRQYKNIVKGLITMGSVLLVLSLPWLILNANGFFSMFDYHLQRGLHSESSYGSILLLGKTMGLVQVRGVFNFGSWNLESPLADKFAGISLVIMIGLLVVAYVLYFRALRRVPRNARETNSLKPSDSSMLLRYVAAAVFIFISAGKVFSMQYLVWLSPLLPLITGRWRNFLVMSFMVAGAFSQFIFPHNYLQFELHRPYTVIIIAARNFLMLVSAVLLLFPARHFSTGGCKAHLEGPT